MKTSSKILFIFIVFIITVQQNAFGTVFDTIIERLKKHYVAENDTAKATSVFLAQAANGGWESLNYKDPSAAAWQPREHLKNLQTMALAYQSPTHNLYQNPKVLNGIINGLNFWYTINPVSTNWWHNKIGKQHHLAKTAIVLYNELPDTLIASIAKEQATSTEHYTGQNLLWMAEEMIWKGLFEKNADLLQKGTGALQSVMLISEDEGIMPDYSFRQHGPQLYSGGGGYGVPFLLSNIMWAYCLHGLPFAYSEEKIEILSGYILDGSSWMIRRNYWDFQTAGRTLVRKGALKCSHFVTFLQLMPEVDTKNKERYHDFINHIKGKNDRYLSGNKYFPWSDYVVHRRENFFFSIHMNSTRTYRTENGNEENVKGRYLADGGTTIMLQGNEYVNTFPCWDWSNVPGTTTPQRKTIPPFKKWGFAGTTEFTGAVSDGSDGVAVYEMDYDSLKAKKTWFMFDNIVACLVSDIHSTSSHPITTTLNQVTKKGNIWIKNHKEKTFIITDTISIQLNAEKIWHNGIGYIIPGKNENVQIHASAKINDWKEIGSYSTETLEQKDIFNLFKIHDNLKKDNSFVYYIVPGISLDDFKKTNINELQVVNNNSSYQAVINKKNNTYGMVFHQAGTINITKNLVCTVSHPCLAMIKIKDDKLITTVSDPTQKLTEIDLSIQYRKKNIKTVISLPQGKEKGMSQELISFISDF